MDVHHDGRRLSSCPCTIWPSTATPAGTDGDTSSVELGVKFRASTERLHHRHPLLQARRDHRHPRRHPVDAAPAPGSARSPSPTRPPAAGSRRPSPRPIAGHGRHDLRRLLLHAQPVRRQLGATSPPRHHARAADGPAERHRRRQRPLPLHHHAGHVPRPARYNSENYWVDVVFEDGPDTTTPTVTARTPAPGATGVAVGANVTATFSEPIQQSTLGLELRGPGGTLVAGTTTYDAATRTATLDPTATLAGDDDLHRDRHRRARHRGQPDRPGRRGPSPPTRPTRPSPTVTSRTPAPGRRRRRRPPSTRPRPSARPVQPAHDRVRAAHAGATRSSPARRPTTPTTPHRDPRPDRAASRPARPTPRRSAAPRDAAGNQMDPVTWTFTTAATTSSCPCTIWPRPRRPPAPTPTPARSSWA